MVASTHPIERMSSDELTMYVRRYGEAGLPSRMRRRIHDAIDYTATDAKFGLTAKQRHLRGVICEGTGEWFPTMQAAADAKGLAGAESIHNSIAGVTFRAAGHFWRYATALEKQVRRALMPATRAPRERYCGVIRVECESWFPTIDAAAFVCKCHGTQIFRSLKNPRSKAAGSAWRYATPAEWLAINTPTNLPGTSPATPSGGLVAGCRGSASDAEVRWAGGDPTRETVLPQPLSARDDGAGEVGK